MEGLVMRRCCCKCGISVHKCAVVTTLLSMVLSGLMLAASIYDLQKQKKGTGLRNWILYIVMRYDTNDIFADYRVMTLSVQLTLVMITNSAIAFVFGVFALYGILMRKKYYVLPWLIFNGTSLIGLIFVFVIFSIVFPLGLVLLLAVVPYGYLYIVGHSFFFRLAAAEARAREAGEPLQSSMF